MHTQVVSWAPSSSSAQPLAEAHSWATSPLLSSTARDSDLNDFDQPPLTSDSRPRPHSSLPPSPPILPETPPPFAISNSSYNLNPSAQCQDVLPLNSSASFPSSTAPRSNGHLCAPLESSLSNSHHVPINTDNNRLRTSSVFTTSQDLAAHYGIPQNFPPPPRPIPRRSSQQQQQQPSPDFDFDSIRKNYLAMLAQNPTEPDPTSPAPTVPPAGSTVGADAMQAIHDLLASPEFQTLQSFDATSPLFDDNASLSASPLFDTPSPSFDVDAYLTSPMETPYDDFAASPNEDSPFSDFLTTPVIAGDADMLTGPLIEDLGYDPNLDLFGGVAAFPTYEVSAAPKLPSTTELYTISPGTPALDSVDPTTTLIPKKPKTDATPAPPPSTRRTTATGTRKNLKPESLIPLEAPTQRRSYVTPSATSRKVVPAVFANKKRARAEAFGEDEELPPLAPTATEQEAIEHKRRQNTLAARKSRKRKLEHQQMLENEIDALKADRDQWKTKALMARDMLVSSGLPAPFDDDEE